MNAEKSEQSSLNELFRDFDHLPPDAEITREFAEALLERVNAGLNEIPNDVPQGDRRALGIFSNLPKFFKQFTADQLVTLYRQWKEMRPDTETLGQLEEAIREASIEDSDRK